VRASGEFDDHRAAQATRAMWTEVQNAALERLAADPAVANAMATAEAEVAAGRLAPTVAARQVLSAWEAGGTTS
jgi:LAO/AO transport system kinase